MGVAKFCKCGCRDREVVRRATLRVVCSFLVGEKDDEAKEQREKLMATLEKISFCCTYQLRSYYFNYVENRDIFERFPHHVDWMRKDMLRICDAIVDDHKSCSRTRCSMVVTSAISLQYYTKHNYQGSLSERPMSDETLYLLAGQLFDEGFIYFTYDNSEKDSAKKTATSADELFIYLASLPPSFRNQQVAVRTALRRYHVSDGEDYSAAVVPSFNEVGFMMVAMRNMVGLVLDDDYFVFLFPQRFIPLSDRSNHRIMGYEGFPSPKMKIAALARLFLANTKPLHSVIGGFLSGCSLFQTYFHFLQRFPPRMLKFLENVPGLADDEQVDEFMAGCHNPWPIADCTEIIRTAVLGLLREPKFVVGALREWYRYDRHMWSPNGRTFDDALTIARKFADDPLFKCVAKEVKQFLDAKEWDSPKSYKISTEILFPRLPWRCECKSGFEYGKTLDDAVMLKFIPSLKRLEPELTEKMTNAQLLNEMNDTLKRVHPCVLHFLKPVVNEYAVLCPFVLDSVVEYLRDQRDVHSPYNVAKAMWKFHTDDLDGMNKKDAARLFEMFKKAHALEKEGLEVMHDWQKKMELPECDNSLVFTRSLMQKEEKDRVRRRMLPCECKKPEFSFTLTGMIACKIVYAWSVKINQQTPKQAILFRMVVEIVMRLPHRLQHGLEYVLPDKTLTSTMHLFNAVQNIEDDEGYYERKLLEIYKDGIPKFDKNFLEDDDDDDAASPMIREEATAKCMKEMRKRQRQNEQKQKEERERQERRARLKTKKINKSSPQWMEPPKPSAQPQPKPTSSSAVQVPKDVLPAPIPCSICVLGGGGVIYPRKEVYVKVKCYKTCSHSIALHKTCFRTAFDGKRKKEIKNDGQCPMKDCGAKMESIYEVDMDRDLTETLFLKWEPPVVQECAAAQSSATLTSTPEEVSPAQNSDSELTTTEVLPEEQEPPKSERDESTQFCLKQDVRRAVVSRPPLPLSMADFAVRLEKKTAESVEKYATVDGMSTKTKKPRQRQQKETINLVDLTGSSIARVPGRRVVGADDINPRRCRSTGNQSSNTGPDAAESSNQDNLQPDLPPELLEELDENDETLADFPTCSICLDLLFVNDEAEVECRHCEQTIHRKCVEQWLIKEQSCPMCRANWPSDEQFPPLR